ncbi:cell division protein FtsX [Chloroherpeton thalassium]|uniref:cell division protein FtsX n=1 Tax=Chloroherpeton thalassium TaxID=100716 RepID=UPI001B7FE01D|nr:permease-like cell division protein FtsX [Chloroherpeton thalassium]
MSVVTVTISLILLGIFALLSLSFFQVLSEVRSRVELEAFLSETVTAQEAQELQQKLTAIPAVKETKYISKEDAALLFHQEFGEDIQSVLGTNPLPTSIKILLNASHATLDSLDLFIPKIEALPGISEIKYNKEFLSGIDKNARLITYITAGVGFFISLASIALVSNTIRLTIHAKRQMLKTMELVGATPSFIRLPFLIEGAWQGIFGGALAVLMIFLLVEFVVWEYDKSIYTVFVEPARIMYPVLALSGFLLGLAGSSLSVRKFIR